MILTVQILIKFVKIKFSDHKIKRLRINHALISKKGLYHSFFFLEKFDSPNIIHIVSVFNLDKLACVDIEDMSCSSIDEIVNKNLHILPIFGSNEELDERSLGF